MSGRPTDWMMFPFILIILFLETSCSHSPRPTEASSPIVISKSAGIGGNWESLGLPSGVKAPDITLFSPEGKTFRLYDELQQGKPLVIFNASYTCDVSRHNLPKMNSIMRQFDNKARFFVVYTIEPHPADTISPYADSLWIPDNNIKDIVTADQPKTYGERVALAKLWRDRYHLGSEIVVDSPDNDYWQTFGQAPNMVYVINPEGTVFYKQSWFREKELEAELNHIATE